MNSIHALRPSGGNPVLPPYRRVIAPVLLALAFAAFTLAIPDEARGQLHELVAEDTTVSEIVINPSFPGSSSIIIFSDIPHLIIKSPLEFMDLRRSPESGESTLTVPPDTPYQIEIQYPGFRPLSFRTPPLEEGEVEAYVVTPASNLDMGTLSLSTIPTGAGVEVDGILLGQTNMQLLLPEGGHGIRIILDGFNPIEFTEAIRGGDMNLQRFTLAREDQPLSVTSNVGRARVFLNDVEIGFTPIESRPTPQGLMRVRVESPGYLPYEETLEIRSGQDNVVHAELETFIQLLPTTSAYIRNVNPSIQDNTLYIAYDLADERKKYTVDVTFMGPNNAPIDVLGVTGDAGKKIRPGRGRVIAWPIDPTLPQEGLKVRLDARPHSNALLYIGGGVGLGGAAILAVTLLGGDEDGPGVEDRVISPDPPGRPTGQ